MSAQRLLRVTEILYPFSGLGAVDPEVLAHAAERGTKVHKICESIIEGLGEWGVDQETRGYVDSFKQWWSFEPQVIAMEKRFFCHELGITGQVDLILGPPECAVVLDIKTPLKESKTWKLQGSAYAYLARLAGYNIKGIQFLRLDKYGGPPELYEYEENFDLFKNALEIFNYFFRKKTSGTTDYNQT